MDTYMDTYMDTSAMDTTNPFTNVKIERLTTINRKWKEERDELEQRSKIDTRKMQRVIDTLQRELEETNARNYFLNVQNIELAKSLTNCDFINQETESHHPSSTQFKYGEIDGSYERIERAQIEIEKQLKNVREIVSTLQDKTCTLQESENMRQAELYLHSPPPNEELDLMKIQIQAYQDDFSCERRDRERAHQEIERLREQLTNAHESISSLKDRRYQGDNQQRRDINTRGNRVERDGQIS